MASIGGKRSKPRRKLKESGLNVRKPENIMNTGNADMTSTIIMMAIIALIVVAGLAASLIAIALQSIKSVDGKCPHSPASWPETPVDVLRQGMKAPESSMDPPRGR